jgi:hypothetical protein
MNAQAFTDPEGLRLRLYRDLARDRRVVIKGLVFTLVHEPAITSAAHSVFIAPALGAWLGFHLPLGHGMGCATL